MITEVGTVTIPTTILPLAAWKDENLPFLIRQANQGSDPTRRLIVEHDLQEVLLYLHFFERWRCLALRERVFHRVMFDFRGREGHLRALCEPFACLPGELELLQLPSSLRAALRRYRERCYPEWYIGPRALIVPLREVVSAHDQGIEVLTDQLPLPPRF
jgi:hypothetical protein